jgi:hypothetical protein
VLCQRNLDGSYKSSRLHWQSFKCPEPDLDFKKIYLTGHFGSIRIFQA